MEIVLFMWALIALGYFALIMYRRHISNMRSMALVKIDEIDKDILEEQEAMEYHYDEAATAEATIEEYERDKAHWQKYLRK